MPRKFIQNKVQDVCNIVRTRIKSKICCEKIVDLHLSVSFINDAIYEFTYHEIIDVYQLCYCQIIKTNSLHMGMMRFYTHTP